MSDRAKIEFLQEKIRDAKNSVKTGSISAIAGVVFIGIGAIINKVGAYHPPYLNIAIILMVLGGFLALIGVPLLIVNALGYRDLTRELQQKTGGTSTVAQGTQ
jgi:zinc transporter ZupT